MKKLIKTKTSLLYKIKEFYDWKPEVKTETPPPTEETVPEAPKDDKPVKRKNYMKHHYSDKKKGKVQQAIKLELAKGQNRQAQVELFFDKTAKKPATGEDEEEQYIPQKE